MKTISSIDSDKISTTISTAVKAVNLLMKETSKDLIKREKNNSPRWEITTETKFLYSSQIAIRMFFDLLKDLGIGHLKTIFNNSAATDVYVFFEYNPKCPLLLREDNDSHWENSWTESAKLSSPSLPKNFLR